MIIKRSACLRQIKFAQWHQKFAEMDPKISPRLNEPSSNGRKHSYYSISDEISPNHVKLSWMVPKWFAHKHLSPFSFRLDDGIFENVCQSVFLILPQLMHSMIICISWVNRSPSLSLANFNFSKTFGTFGTIKNKIKTLDGRNSVTRFGKISLFWHNLKALCKFWVF